MTPEKEGYPNPEATEDKRILKEIEAFTNPDRDPEITTSIDSITETVDGENKNLYRVELNAPSEESSDGRMKSNIILEKFFDKEGNSVFFVERFNVSFGNKRYNQSDFGIGKNLKLRIVPSMEYSGTLTTSEPTEDGRITFAVIDLQTFCGPESIAAILHEVGHFKNIQDKPLTKEERYAQELKDTLGAILQSSEKVKRAQMLMYRERAAEANALKTARTLGIPIMQTLKQQRKLALEWYNCLGEELGDISDWKTFASSKKRAEIRKKVN